MSEYVGAYARRLEWLTGFHGSTGVAVVLPSEAAIFVDGRYSLQVRTEVSASEWSYESLRETAVSDWLARHAPHGARIGYDPWLHTPAWVRGTRLALKEQHAQLVAVDSNPVDSVWLDRPLPSVEKLHVHPDAIAGVSSREKRQTFAKCLIDHRIDVFVLSSLDSIAWLFNLRGNDIEYTPVALCYALVNADGSAQLFVDPRKLSTEVSRHLGDEVRVQAREHLTHALSELAGKRVGFDPTNTVEAIFEALRTAGARLRELRNPAVRLQSIKNGLEVAGHRAAQLLDNVALTRFLHWISTNVGDQEITELSAAKRLLEFRRATLRLHSCSFETISAFGPNAALVHYRATERTNRAFAPGALYLVDSGGQYPEGTTDITRTIAIGAPSAEMRDRFTRVLKGHIALARAVFPAGTRGGQIDVLARQYLWGVGLDYAHSTGHGVGSFLSVHEGPQSIAASPTYAGIHEPLVAGMILSNEPGYYKAGEYGMRLENLMLVVERHCDVTERQMLGFEMLSFAPIDRELIDTDSLTPEECKWLDAYHSEVARRVAPEMEEGTDARAWLDSVTRPLIKR